MGSRLRWFVILYLIEENFESDMLYEATDVAQWLGQPHQHRLMRYYLNRFVRESRIVRLKWDRRYFFGRKELCEGFKDIFEGRGGTKFEVGR